MKKLKQFAFGILGATILSVGLFACSNDESNNLKQENTQQTTNFKSREDGNIEIAEIRDGKLFFLVDLDILKT